MRDKNRLEIVVKRKQIMERLASYPEKLKSVYILNYSLMEMIFDMQFVILYIVKILRILVIRFISYDMAVNTAIQQYEYLVYEQKKAPPSLINFMWIFFGFDLFFHAFMLIFLGLSTYLFKSDTNNFPVDAYLMKKFAFDYLSTTTLIMVIGFLIGRTIREKKYFRYKHEGQRGIRAFADMMKTISITITLIPMFLVNPF
jgi:hypothetical protein